MSDYNPAEHAYCHVCGHWTRLARNRRLFRHRYGGASGSDYCIGGRYKVGEIIPGYAGPYVRDPRPVDPQDKIARVWWEDDYHHGYRGHLLHPHSPSTGSEGRCDLCGGYSGSPMHSQPWERLKEPDETYQRWKYGEVLPPVPPKVTDTRWEARQERLGLLKAPAVSNPSPGGIEKVVRRFPDSAEDEGGFGTLIDQVLGRTSSTYLDQAATIHEAMEPGDIEPKEHTMNLNITTTDGTVKAVRAYVTSADGTQGVFAEADDHAGAIAQAAGAVLGGSTAADFAGYTVPEAAKPSGLVFKASAAPASQGRLRNITTSSVGIKRLVRAALTDDNYVRIDYTNTVGDRERRVRKVYPLYELNDRSGFVAREHGITGRSPKTFKWSGIFSAEEVAD